MPSDVPANLTGWWCNPSDEYGFLGFSYEVTACEFLHSPPPLIFFWEFLSLPSLAFSPGQSLTQLQTDFANIRNTLHGRYVRLYGACNNEGF
jgi:hypothetical protein